MRRQKASHMTAKISILSPNTTTGKILTSCTEFLIRPIRQITSLLLSSSTSAENLINAQGPITTVSTRTQAMEVCLCKRRTSQQGQTKILLIQTSPHDRTVARCEKKFQVVETRLCPQRTLCKTFYSTRDLMERTTSIS